MRTTAGRLEATDARPCYAELTVDSVIIQRDWVNGTSLQMLLRFRAFDGTSVKQSFGSFLAAPLKNFPVTAGDISTSAKAEIASAYTTNLRDFGTALQKPRKSGK